MHTEDLVELVVSVLDEHSAHNIVSLDVRDKCQLAEHMIIASGNSSHHVKALAEYVKKKASPYHKSRIQGLNACNWVVMSLGNVIVHIFRDEVRQYYDLESLWNTDAPQDTQYGTAHSQ
ncbi:ribosome silencing factor [Candidatus Anaplasma sp. TIGMIC]|uniref:ribosome silencing factor n=1 Tax=Candidatus Anaplasma sp. TIGMIC TaxID=3020713 RepID=UPI00232E054E|nr:ribosome silencing factor [Candidatus Anaplasma sp. TIGMIC]